MARWLTATALVLTAVVLVILPGCKSTDTSTKKSGEASATGAQHVFEYSSGGASHPEGFGEWRVRLTSGGLFTVTHVLGERATVLGTFFLTKAETDRLWQLITDAGIGSEESSTRAGVPDEVKHAFTLRGKDADKSVSVWANDLDKHESLAAVRDEIKQLIKAYTGKKPVL